MQQDTVTPSNTLKISQLLQKITFSVSVVMAMNSKKAAASPMSYDGYLEGEEDGAGSCGLLQPGKGASGSLPMKRLRAGRCCWPEERAHGARRRCCMHRIRQPLQPSAPGDTCCHMQAAARIRKDFDD